METKYRKNKSTPKQVAHFYKIPKILLKYVA